jgi:hypothetical protein
MRCVSGFSIALLILTLGVAGHYSQESQKIALKDGFVYK